MKSLTIRQLLLLALCAFLVPLAHADDTALFDTGKNVYPINNDNIRMVSERVIVYRKNVQDIYIKRRIANVDCEFVFENITDEVQEVKLGFPGMECTTSDPNCFAGLNNFISYVDGKEVPVTIKEEHLRYHYRNEDGKDVEVGEQLKRGWYTWDVTFPPRSRLTLRNTYETVLGSDTIGHYWFDYVLVTGDNWSGPIGSAVIEVIYENEDYLRRRVGRIEPGGFEIEGNKVVWELEDFKPQENIHIFEINDSVILGYYLVGMDFIAYFDSKEYEGAERLYTSDDLGNPIAVHDEWLPQKIYPLIGIDVVGEELERYYVGLLKNEIYARHGRRFVAMSSYMVFGDFTGNTISWYKENPNYSDDMLNEIERQNIRFIEEYEKGKGWL